MGWTQERLATEIGQRLGDAKLIVVSNREPYVHAKVGNTIEWKRPAGGVVTALDPMMQAIGGVWVGHGAGDADRDTVDNKGRVAVPPDDPSYTLRRVWLSEELEAGYYYGFANSTLWPLCHHVYSRPSFQPEDWEAYQQANAKFAEAVLEEAQGGPAFIFVQDYHFALLPRMLKQARPDLTVAQFWHIPWPNYESFRVCPWACQILDGMLGNDLLGFHTTYHCNNFLDTVDRMLESRIDRERISIFRKDHETVVQPHPISVDAQAGIAALGNDWESRANAFRKKHNLKDRQLLVGIDRVDYTKGLLERFNGLERLLEKHPETHGSFHFIQAGAPSRTIIPAYRDLNELLGERISAINAKFGTPDWQPILYLLEQFSQADLQMLFRMANGCVVSSLHDGMNLVAKEFVSVRTDDQGVLVLSVFTGAARELTDAVIVNPFDVESLSNGLMQALTMPADEQRRRMSKMRSIVTEHDIYAWAGDLLSESLDLMPNEPKA